MRYLYQSFFDPNPQIGALLGYKIATFSSLYFIFSGCYSLSKMQIYSATNSMTVYILVLTTILFYHYAGECIVITLYFFLRVNKELWFRENLPFVERNLPLSPFSKNLQFQLN